MCPVRHRVDPLDLPDSYFKSRFRFYKIRVRRLVDLVRPNLNLNDDNPNVRRGKPFSAEQIVCAALNIMGGGHFWRRQGRLQGRQPWPKCRGWQLCRSPTAASPPKIRILSLETSMCDIGYVDAPLSVLMSIHIFSKLLYLNINKSLSYLFRSRIREEAAMFVE